MANWVFSTSTARCLSLSHLSKVTDSLHAFAVSGYAGNEMYEAPPGPESLDVSLPKVGGNVSGKSQVESAAGGHFEVHSDVAPDA